MLPAVAVKAATIAAFLVFSLLLTFILRFPESPSQYLPRLSSRPKPIPNILHFTYLKKNTESGITFDFESFLYLYAADTHLKPTHIYIHTDHNATHINKSLKTGNKWTQKILSYPKVKIHHVRTVSVSNNQVVEAIEAKSDFVRWDMIYDLGGIYIDWDVVTLRDLRIYREAGFNNVVGRQNGGQINSGTFMCKPGSALAYLMKRDQHRVFDGGWTTHAVDLLTNIAERVAKSPGEVLILDEKAMAPTTWWPEGNDALFMPHEDTTIPPHPQVNDPTEDPILLWDNKVRSEDWEMDFSQTYLLHAFKSRGHAVQGFHGVTPRYVLARNSNYALATWPIVQRMVRHGLITGDENTVY